MKICLAFACVFVVAASATAQVNYYRATQQARRDSAQNDAEQQRIAREANGGAANANAAAAAPATPVPVDPALQATLNNISGLQSDFAGLANATGDKADASQKISLLNNLTQAAQGTKASSV